MGRSIWTGELAWPSAESSLQRFNISSFSFGDVIWTQWYYFDSDINNWIITYPFDKTHRTY